MIIALFYVGHAVASHRPVRDWFGESVGCRLRGDRFAFQSPQERQQHEEMLSTINIVIINDKHTRLQESTLTMTSYHCQLR